MAQETTENKQDEQAEDDESAPTETKNKGRGEDRDRDNNGDNDNEKKNDRVQKDDQQRDEKQSNEPKKPPFYKRPVPMLIMSGVAVLLIFAGVIWWLNARQYESTDDAFIDGHVVAISPNVAATVAAVHIDDNWRVKRGDLLIELDPRDFQVIVDQMRANLHGAKDRVVDAHVQLRIALANVEEGQAALAAAQTNAGNAQRTYERFASVDERSRSEQQLDDSRASARSNTDQVAQAKAKLEAAEANASDARVAIKTAEAAEQTAEANLNQANINLAYCKIFAPTDGLVTRKSVEPGDYVDKAQPLFSLVPTNVWVTANYKETQLDLLRLGQDVTIKVDAYSDHEFHGKIDSIQNGTGSRFTLLPTENATGNYVKIVQRVPVKIVFNPHELDKIDFLLAPGMSVVPTVKVR